MLALRPFVSLCDFRAAHASRQPAAARRLLACRRLAAAAAGQAAPAPPTAPKYASLPAEQQQQVDAFLDILLDWNQRMNLSAITDRAEAYERHVNDSLALLPAIDRCLASQRQHRRPQQQQQQQKEQQQQQAGQPGDWERGGSVRSKAAGSPAAGGAAAGGAGGGEQEQAGASALPRLVDVGSGAGLPGIILAIARPEWDVTLLDSLQKRCKFTEAAVEAAGLRNVRVKWGRAEEAGQNPGLREQHDVAVARAVAELRILAELCLPLVRTGGHWVAAKGASPEQEVSAAGPALQKLGGKLLGVEEVDSESPEGRRTVVVVAKSKATPAQYPRRPGTPGKKPL